MQFSMLLGTQVLGCLTSNGFNGTVKISTSTDSASAWFMAGSVSSLRTTRDSESAAIPFFVNTTNGEISTKAETLNIERLDYQQSLEDFLETTPVNFQSLIPLSMAITCSAGKGVVSPSLKYSPNIHKIQTISGNGTSLNSIIAAIPAQDFWKTFIMATSIGAVIPSYHKLLGEIVRKYQDSIDTEIKRFMGIAISHSFNTKVDQAIIDWRECFTDPVYGARPFESWAKAIVIAVSEVVPSTIAEKMLAKVLGTLPLLDQKTISLLVS